MLLVLAVRSSLEQLKIVSWVQERQAMANLYENAAGVWLIRFRFDGRQYYRSLDTVDEKEATGVKAQVEETLGLLKRGRLSLPPSAGFDEAALFIISGGKITERPAVHNRQDAQGSRLRRVLRGIAGRGEGGQFSLYREGPCRPPAPDPQRFYSAPTDWRLRTSGLRDKAEP